MRANFARNLNVSDMNVLIVYAHPEPKSMNGALFTLAIDHLKSMRHEVRTSDLYHMGFNPVSNRENFNTVLNPDFFKQQLEEIHATGNNGFANEINAEQEKVEWCDLMIWQFPLWWFSMPGILKGWVDRVFAMGRFYNNGQLYDNGVFKGKKAMVSLTTGGPQDSYVDGGFNGDLYAMLKPIHRGIFEFTGFSVLEPHIIYGPARKTQQELAEEIERYKIRLNDISKDLPITVGNY